MRWRNWRSWLAAILAGSGLIGCEKSGTRPNYPPDPLLVHKTPVDGKTAELAPVLLAQREPLMPPIPKLDLAAAPAGFQSLAWAPNYRLSVNTNETPVVDRTDNTSNSARPPLQATPASRTSTGPDNLAKPATRERQPARSPDG
jgi:hypothetical protein